jgi:hypothetical protein
MLLGLSAAPSQGPPPEVRAQVAKLVGQLGAADAEAQVGAEWALLRLGPVILPLLPTPKPDAQDAASQRLRTVLGTLREVRPRTFTLQRDRIALKEALKELARQTGIAVADLTGRPDATLAVTCKELPFWQALDAIAAKAGARVALYSPKGLALVEAAPAKQAHPEPGVSYHGMFRTTLKHVSVSRDLETGAHTCVLHLDVAWEPRFPAFLLGAGPAAVVFARDADGNMLQAKLPSAGRDQLVPSASAHEIVLRTRAPARSSPALASLKGTLVVTGASKLLTFTFERLREIGPKDKAEGQTREGVKVRLTEVTRETDPDRLLVEVTIDNPPGGPVFESYQSWLGLNALWLEKKGGKQRVEPDRLPEISQPSAGQAVVRYEFPARGKKLRLGPLNDWVLHYRTPGRMVELTVPYEFKNVLLP